MTTHYSNPLELSRSLQKVAKHPIKNICIIKLALENQFNKALSHAEFTLQEILERGDKYSEKSLSYTIWN